MPERHIRLVLKVVQQMKPAFQCLVPGTPSNVGEELKSIGAEPITKNSPTLDGQPGRELPVRSVQRKRGKIVAADENDCQSPVRGSTDLVEPLLSAPKRHDLAPPQTTLHQ